MMMMMMMMMMMKVWIGDEDCVASIISMKLHCLQRPCLACRVGKGRYMQINGLKQQDLDKMQHHLVALSRSVESVMWRVHVCRVPLHAHAHM